MPYRELKHAVIHSVLRPVTHSVLLSVSLLKNYYGLVSSIDADLSLEVVDFNNVTI